MGVLIQDIGKHFGQYAYIMCVMYVHQRHTQLYNKYNPYNGFT